jgi:hypothetical protein
MPDGEEKARQFMPFSSFDSDKPEDLWAWLDETSERVGTDFVAIPMAKPMRKFTMSLWPARVRMMSKDGSCPLQAR